MDYTKAIETLKALEEFTTARDALATQLADLDAKIDTLNADLRSTLTPYIPPVKRQARRERGATSAAIIARAQAEGTINAVSIANIVGSRKSAAIKLAGLAKRGLLNRVGVGQYTANDQH